MSAVSAKTQDPSMDEILASIRRIIADDQDSEKPGGPAASGQGRAFDDAEVLDLADLEPVPSAYPPSERETEIPEVSFRPAAKSATQSAPAGPPEPTPRPLHVAMQPAAAPPPEAALVSDQTTASVSHAFSLLSHTILTQNARTLEDLVGDMLKPMLKVWLDDNLPPLVERLVRHEIERVARGSR